jgi:cysteine desulfurase/selenocysteine lyase
MHMTAMTKEDDITGEAAYDVETIRTDFPILFREVYGKPLIYLDNGASAQKPRSVLDAIDYAYKMEYANVHRGLHFLSNAATARYEDARETVRRFLNAPSVEEIIFTRNATEGINLVASSYGAMAIGKRDEIVLTVMEHHSNIVPWQLVCEERGAHLRVAPIDDTGALILEELYRLIGPRTKIVSIAHMSNALGTINPVEEIVALAHSRGVPVLIDGSQAAYHMPVDVQSIGCEFYVATGHKLYGPTGIGVLVAKAERLEAMPPFLGGGDMIRTVTFERSTWNDLPYKFEAGTPNIAGAIGLGAAIDYIQKVGREAISAHEQELLRYGTAQLEAIRGVRIIGTAAHKSSILSFVMDGVHPHDIGTIVDREGVAVRTGHHCAQPVMDRFGIPATARASLAMYNTKEDLDALARALEKVREVFN